MIWGLTMVKYFTTFIFAALLLSGCADTSDRYAFWRDSAAGKGGNAPNLGDVPAPPNTQDAKAEMEAMRQRLEIERQNTFRAADGLPPLADTNNTMDAPAADMPATTAPLTWDEPSAATDTTALPAPMPADQQWQSSGNVQINPMPGNDNAYIYGNSPVQTRLNSQAVPTTMPSTDPSISIDMSVLNDVSAATYPSVLSTASGDSVAYFSHGSAAIGRNAKQKIHSLAQRLRHSPGSVVLVGHASQRTGVSDPITSQAINVRMAAKRAETVLRELSRQGIAAEKVKIAAMGDSQPNPNPEGKPQEDADRRVEVLFNQ